LVILGQLLSNLNSLFVIFRISDKIISRNQRLISAYLRKSIMFSSTVEEQHCRNEGGGGGGNKHVLITGANQGIGLSTALALARRGGYDLTLACRNEDRARTAVKAVNEAALQASNRPMQVRYVLVDLAQLDSVHRLVAQFRAARLRFDIVVLNAGVLHPNERVTVDGIETTFQVNFLSQYIIVRDLCAQQCPEHPLHVVTVINQLIIAS
jgi:NAD(P)-dependent dehydrogenase (short-subunit alcohol dehydrogenase family)